MIYVPITDKMKKWAKKLWTKKRGKNYLDMGTDSVYLGCLGEAVFYVNHRDFKHRSRIDHDFYKGEILVDSKAYRAGVVPRPNFCFTIPSVDIVRYKRNIIYCRIAVMEDESEAYIIGYITSDDFKAKAYFTPNGEQRVGRPKGMLYLTDGWEIPNTDLCSNMDEIDYFQLGEDTE